VKNWGKAQQKVKSKLSTLQKRFDQFNGHEISDGRRIQTPTVKVEVKTLIQCIFSASDCLWSTFADSCGGVCGYRLVGQDNQRPVPKAFVVAGLKAVSVFEPSRFGWVKANHKSQISISC